MKLYNANLSPFAARCRIQIYAKGLAVEMTDPPGGLHSATYDAINPIGKVPCLEDGAFRLPESELICEYLEDRFPEKAMRPADAEGRARVRLVSRVCDLYLMAPMGVLFGQLNPKTRDEKVVAEKSAEAKKALGLIEGFVGTGSHAVGNSLTLADCTLVTMLFFVVSLGGAIGMGAAPLADYPKLQAYWTRVSAEPVVARVLGEMGEALKKMQGG